MPHCKPGTSCGICIAAPEQFRCFLAGGVKRVTGIENVAAAIADATRNAVHNEIANVEFICGDVRETLQKAAMYLLALPSPDCVVIDPPRSGMHPDVVQMLLRLAPKRIVYVSPAIPRHKRGT